MSAKNFMSSILDELMGRNRNAGPDDKPKAVSWDDPDICSHYLVSFCPNELFVNTKADLGPCIKLHDDQLRKKYSEEAPNNRKLQFENEFIRFADKMIQDIEAKIKRGKMRIALANGPDGGTYAGPGSKNAEKIAFLTERINVLLKEAEEAGCGGDVEKAQGLLKLCDQLKEEREQMKSNEVNHPWNPDKAMQVCEVCGSYLIIGEAQHRLDDHIMGKQHMGFALLRKTMDDVRKARETRDMEERDRQNRRFGGGRDHIPDRGGGDRRERDRGDKRRSRSRSRDRRRKDDKRKSKSKSPRRRSRDRKDRKRDRDTSRDRDRDAKSRKHSSDDKGRDKDKDKHRRDKDRKKRSRSRSRDKHRRRSRSGDRHRRRRDDKNKDKEEKDRDRATSSRKLDSEDPKLEGSTPTKSPKMESSNNKQSPEIEENSAPAASGRSSSPIESLGKSEEVSAADASLQWETDSLDAAAVPNEDLPSNFTSGQLIETEEGDVIES